MQPSHTATKAVYFVLITKLKKKWARVPEVPNTSPPEIGGLATTKVQREVKVRDDNLVAMNSCRQEVNCELSSKVLKLAKRSGEKICSGARGKRRRR